MFYRLAAPPVTHYTVKQWSSAPTSAIISNINIVAQCLVIAKPNETGFKFCCDSYESLVASARVYGKNCFHAPESGIRGTRNAKWQKRNPRLLIKQVKAYYGRTQMTKADSYKQHGHQKHKSSKPHPQLVNSHHFSNYKGPKFPEENL